VLGDAVYGYDRDCMESVTGGLLQQTERRLAVAESCTGGLISKKVTTIAGSSNYFLGGVVAYANELKTRFLDVPKTSSTCMEQSAARPPKRWPAASATGPEPTSACR